MFRLSFLLINMCIGLCLLTGCTSENKGIPLEDYNKLQQEINNTKTTLNMTIADYTAEIDHNTELSDQIVNVDEEYEKKTVEINELQSKLDELQTDSVALETSIVQKNLLAESIEDNNSILEKLLLEYETPPGIKLLAQESGYYTWRLQSSSVSIRGLSLDPSSSSRSTYMLYYLGIGDGCTGTSDIDYLQRFDENTWTRIEQLNSIVFFNPQRDTFSELFELWPEEYTHILPFSISALEQLTPPFAWVVEDTYKGRYRVIMIASIESHFLQLTRALMGNSVPVGVPWTYDE